MNGIWETHPWCIVTIIVLLLIMWTYCWKQLPWYYLGMDSRGQPMAVPVKK